MRRREGGPAAPRSGQASALAPQSTGGRRKVGPQGPLKFAACDEARPPPEVVLGFCPHHQGPRCSCWGEQEERHPQKGPRSRSPSLPRGHLGGSGCLAAAPTLRGDTSLPGSAGGVCTLPQSQQTVSMARTRVAKAPVGTTLEKPREHASPSGRCLITEPRLHRTREKCSSGKGEGTRGGTRTAPDQHAPRGWHCSSAHGASGPSCGRAGR